jgi:hypothetical protein
MPTGSPSPYRTFLSPSPTVRGGAKRNPNGEADRLPMPANSSSRQQRSSQQCSPSTRYALQPCITPHQQLHAAIASLSTPASPFSYFLRRILWGSAALGERRAPPHTPRAFPLALQPGRWQGLHRWRAVCSKNPVHHWARCGLAIRCHAAGGWQVAQADDTEASPVPPKPVISRPTVTKCDNTASTAPTCHRWKRIDGMLLATAAMQPSPDRSCSRWQVRHRQPVSHHPTDL